MTDLRTLLHECAPTPARALDMAVVRRRAQRGRARSALAWLGAVGVLLGIAVPTGGSLLAPADGTGVEAIRGPETTTTSAPMADEVADRSERASDDISPQPEGGRDDGSMVVDAESPPTSAASSPEPQATVTKDPDADAYQPAAGCSVDDAGLRRGEQRTCRFIATEPGGASMHSDGPATTPGTQPQGQVTVTRDGVSTTYDVVATRATAQDPTGEELAVFAGCGTGQVIEPGDLVEVVLTRTSQTEPTTTTALTAGDGWGC